MIVKEKTENFRVNIRKARNEELFKQKRQTRSDTPKIERQNQTILIENFQKFNHMDILLELAQVIQEENRIAFQFDELKYIVNQKLERPLVEFLLAIIQILNQKDIDELFQECNLSERLLNMYKTEKDLFYLLRVQNLLGSFSKNSILCQTTLLNNQILQIVLDVISKLEIEFDDDFMNSLVVLLITFIEKLTRIPFEEVKSTIKVLDLLCQKLRQINYLDTQQEMDEERYNQLTHLAILKNILKFLKVYIDRSSFETNLTTYRNVWHFVYHLAFEMQDEYSLRLLALQVLSESLKIDERCKLDVIHFEQNILARLICLMECHKSTQKLCNSIRLHASKIIKCLMSVNSSYAIGFIHHHKFPHMFLELIQDEQHPLVLMHMLEAFAFICRHSAVEQCQELFFDRPGVSGLLSVMMRCFQTMKETEQYDFGKPLVECNVQLNLVTYEICKQLVDDKNLKQLLRQHKIDIHLQDIALKCRHQRTASRTHTILQYLN